MGQRKGGGTEKVQESMIRRNDEQPGRFRKNNAVDLRPGMARAVSIGWGSGKIGEGEGGEKNEARGRSLTCGYPYRTGHGTT